MALEWYWIYPAITLMVVCEIIGNGTIFGIQLLADGAKTVLLFIMPPGAFITYGFLIAIVNRLKKIYNF